jgi:hypothetical protein
MGEHMPSDDTVSKLFGNLSIFGKEGNVSAFDTKEQTASSGGASARGENSSDAQHAIMHHGDLDGQSFADAHGHAMAAPIDSEQTKMAKLSQQQQLPGMENMPVAARTSTTILKSERARQSAQAEKAEKAQKSNTKRDISSYSDKLPKISGISLGHATGNGELSLNHDNKAGQASTEHISQSERSSQSEHSSHISSNGNHQLDNSIDHRPGNTDLHKPESSAVQKPEHTAVQKPENPVSQKPEHTAIQKPENPVSQKPEHTAIQKPENPVSQKPENSAIRKPENSVSQKPEHTAIQKPENPVSQKPENSANQKPELPASQKHEHTAIQKPENSVAPKLENPTDHKPESVGNTKSEPMSANKSDSTSTHSREQKTNSANTDGHTNEKLGTQQSRQSNVEKQPDSKKTELTSQRNAASKNQNSNKRTSGSTITQEQFSRQANQSRSNQEQNLAHQANQVRSNQEKNSAHEAKSNREQNVVHQANQNKQTQLQNLTYQLTQNKSNQEQSSIRTSSKQVNQDSGRARNSVQPDNAQSTHGASLAHSSNGKSQMNAEKSERSQNRADDGTLDLHELHAIHLAGQDHGPGSGLHTTSQHKNHVPVTEGARKTIARSTSSENDHSPQPARIRSINNIVSSLGGHRVDSHHPSPEPEVSNKNNTASTHTSGTSSASGHSPTNPSHAGTGKQSQPTNQGQHQNHKDPNVGLPPGMSTKPGQQTGQTNNKNDNGSNKNSPPATNNNSNKTDPNGQKCADPNPAPNSGISYRGPISIEPCLPNKQKPAQFLLELLSEIGLMAGMRSPQLVRGMNPLLADINNSAIPGNIASTVNQINPVSNPADSQALDQASNLVSNQVSHDSSEQIFNHTTTQTTYHSDLATNISNTSQTAFSDSSNIVYFPGTSPQNASSVNNIGQILTPITTEPVTPSGHGQLSAGQNGNGSGNPINSGTNSNGSDNPLNSDANSNGSNSPLNSGTNGGGSGFKAPDYSSLGDGSGSSGLNPGPNGNPYLTGSVDYWGNNPGSNTNNPGSNPAAPASDDNSAGKSGQHHDRNLEPENAEAGRAQHSGEINQNAEHAHPKENTNHRAEISDAWQTSNHFHEPGTVVHENQLDHKHSHHNSSSQDTWQEQNHGRKHPHVQIGTEQQNSSALPTFNDNVLIGELLGVLTDGQKNKDPQKAPNTYTVKLGETLEIIASKLLGDPKLGQLLYIINKAVLPPQSDWRKCKLRAGLVLLLPTIEEIRCFRIALKEKLKQSGGIANMSHSEPSSSGAIFHETAKNLATRRANIERLLGSFNEIASHSSPTRQKITVRLGDTLRSIALKHDALQDVSLWKLLAELNDLSVAVDSKGIPIAILPRGLTLQLPTASEISAYRSQQSAQRTQSSPRKALQEKVLLSQASI